jgi:hypothetical protein
MSSEKLPEALSALGARFADFASQPRPHSTHDAGVDFVEFQRLAIAPSPLERWLARLPLAQIISDSMPPDIAEIELDDCGMRALAGLQKVVLRVVLEPDNIFSLRNFS